MTSSKAEFNGPSSLAMRSIAFAVACLTGCANMPAPILPDRLPAKLVPKEGMATDPAAAATTSGGPASAPAPNVASSAPARSAAPTTPGRLFETPLPPSQRTATSPSPAVSGTSQPVMESAVSLEQLPLPVFIDTVFTTILKRNISVDPSIAQRKELVSLKSGKPQSAQALFETAKAVLKSYGLAVTEFEGGLVRITPATGASGYLPELLRGRTLPDVPASLRPMFFMVEMESVSPSNVSNWLKTLFGQRINVQEDPTRQALLLAGQSDDIAAALEAIQVLDQPQMRGRISARVAPMFWSADELAKRLSDILQAQGYAVSTNAAAQAPIILLPIGALNSVIVFSSSQAVLNHALRWATELDQPASGRGTAGYFTYPVRNMDAADLAKTLQEVMNPAGPAVANSGSVRSRVVVNASTNTLIIQGNPTEYQQWFGLLQELDRPTRTALVSVTIAEVRLTDTENLGFQWLLKQFSVGGYNVNLKNVLGVSNSANLVATITSPNSSTNALLNMLASTNKARILANPSVMARNGETASIQVGQDVPIITSQQQTVGGTSNVPGGIAQNNVLQSIQYRNTGVILKVKPVIHAGGRIDIDVDQEVSTAISTTIGVTTTPTIQSRKLSTKLSVTDGTTVLLGGLMQEEAKGGDSGVPWLKDIPVAGHLFKTSNTDRTRTELVVLVTPYIISDEFEAQAITEAFRNQFRWDAKVPTHSLRPPQNGPLSKAPENGDAARNATPAPRPYVLPPPDAPETEQRNVPSIGKNVVRPQQSPRDFPGESSSGGVPSSTSPGASSNVALPGSTGRAGVKPGAAVAPGNSSGVGVGKPVDDPQLLKELTDALNRKR
ncbi:type II secretion system protein GspD [Roseateles toxinivorans]|nr:secretin N-terminal domain-containing protein [Roseateles toxinivorans]